MHFITKKYLSRRTVLRGMGVSIALPLLDAMIPARTACASGGSAAPAHGVRGYFPPRPHRKLPGGLRRRGQEERL